MRALRDGFGRHKVSSNKEGPPCSEQNCLGTESPPGWWSGAQPAAFAGGKYQRPDIRAAHRVAFLWAKSISCQ